MNPKTGTLVPQPLMGYRFPEETRDELLADDRIIFSDDPEQLIRLKTYLRDYKEKMPGIVEIDGRRGANELKKIFPESKQAFKNPKTYTLIEWLLSFAAGPNADSFAGSGTTAHAVMKMNQRDGGSRKFILIECESYADKLTAERVRRLISGVPAAKDDEYKTGLGGAFTYCTLGDPLELDALLTGDNLPPFEQLGALLFHMATNEARPAGAAIEEVAGCGYLGESPSRHVWLIYRPDPTFLKSPDSALTLSRAEAIAKARPGKPHLVYAAARFVSQRALNEAALPVELAPLPFSLYRVERPR
jgi:adenine-specific DNA-methyltransferase